MNEFLYKARTARGELRAGTVSALTAAAAQAQLAAQALTATELTPASLSLSARLPWRNRVSARDRALMYRQLALLLRTGTPLTQALEAMHAECPRPRMKRILAEIIDGLRQGLSFAAAIAPYPKIFTPLGIRVVEATEVSGELPSGLARVARHIEFWAEVRSKVLAALSYPCIIFITALGVGAVMNFFAIPKFEKFLTRRNIALPWSTNFVLKTSHLIQDHWLLLLLLGISAIVAFVLAWRHPAGRRRIEGFCLRLPLLSPLLKALAVTQLAAIMEILLRSGIGAVDALRLAGKAQPLQLHEDLLVNATSRMTLGMTLRSALDSPLLPPTALGIIGTGEMSGSLPDSFKDLEDFYGDELNRDIQTLTRLVEPAMLIIIGGIVALVYFSLFQAIIALMGR